MHVILPVSWLKHPFLKNQFSVKSRDDTNKISDSGFDEVDIDTSKGRPVAEVESISHSDIEMGPPKKWEHDKLIPDEMREAIQNRLLPPEKKARIVYNSSVEIMGRLLKDPKNEGHQT